jgi:hypothetical protein
MMLEGFLLLAAPQVLVSVSLLLRLNQTRTGEQYKYYSTVLLVATSNIFGFWHYVATIRILARALSALADLQSLLQHVQYFVRRAMGHKT